MAVEIVDPREQELVTAGDLWLVDPETGRQVHVDTRKRRSPRPVRAPPRPPSATRSAARCAARAPITSSSPPRGDWLRIFAVAPAPRRGRAARGRPGARRGPQPDQGAGMTTPLAVSFAEPILLAGFILVPLAVLAYGSLQRRRQRDSAAWANPALVPGLTTARPGWRRHLPPFLLLLALCALVVRAGAPAAHGRGAAARGEHRDGHRRLGLDERHRRPARTVSRRRSRRPRR